MFENHNIIRVSTSVGWPGFKIHSGSPTGFLFPVIAFLVSSGKGNEAFSKLFCDFVQVT